ncbi:MAG: hypothetical protein HRU26_11520 [Psychroserpens sp.]|nr:hypothetical protein [Psychroserpens sp.]
MADPVCSNRPRKTINSYTENWVACGGNLPVRYRITNTKFPENSEDATLNVLSVVSNAGLAQMEVTGHPYNAGDYVIFTNFTPEDNYNVVARVISDDSANTFTVNIPFTNNDTGNVQLYYNNYAIEVRVYAGIDSSHPHTAEDPISLIGTIRQIPTDIGANQTNFDISQYVKTKLSSVYDPDQTSWPNDLNAWTDFYIEFREVYTGSVTSFIDDSSNYIGKAVYNTLQFGNDFGGNLYGYVFDTDPNAPDASFLTNFNKLLKFETIDNQISIISQEDGFRLSVDGNTTEYSGNGYGVYRLPITLDKNSDYEVFVEAEITRDSGSIDVGQPATLSPSGLSFGDSGSKLYITDIDAEGIFEYDLSTPYDLSTISKNGFFDTNTLSTPDAIVQGISVVNGFFIYVAATENNARFLLELSTEWDITTASLGDDEPALGFNLTFLFVKDLFDNQVYSSSTVVYDDVDASSSFTPAETSLITGIVYNEDGTRLFILGRTEQLIFEYDLSTPYDITTASYSGNSYDPFPSGSSTFSGLDFNDNILYTIDVTNLLVRSINLGSAQSEIKIVKNENLQ